MPKRKSPAARPRSSKPRRARRRAPPNRDRTYGRLLQIATRLFAARGFHGVSVDDIAAAAHVSKRMPYYYFGSKEALYRLASTAVYQRIEGMEIEVVESTLSPPEKLAALAEGYFVFLRDNPDFTRFLLWGNLENGRHFSKVLTKTPLLRRLHQIVEEGIAAGEFRADLDIPHLLINVIGLSFIYFSNHYSLSQVLELNLDSPREHERAVKQMKSILLDGVKVRRAGKEKV